MEAEKLIKNFLYTICNHKDLSIIDDYFINESKIEGPFGVAQHFNTLKSHFLEWFKYFPDLKIKISNNFSANSQSHVVKWVETASHQAEFMGYAATGKAVTYSGCSIFELGSDGKIINLSTHLDLFAIQRQLQDKNNPLKMSPLNTLTYDQALLLNELKMINSYENNNHPLTKREVECISLWLNGKHDKQIATLLKLSFRTVQSYLKNAMLKIGCRSKAELHEKVNGLGFAQAFYQFQKNLSETI